MVAKANIIAFWNVFIVLIAIAGYVLDFLRNNRCCSGWQIVIFFDFD